MIFKINPNKSVATGKVDVVHNDQLFLKKPCLYLQFNPGESVSVKSIKCHWKPVVDDVSK